ncbi:MAG TPA: PEPxxWA-CTERM sorting domain-containing protein, partial [Methylotenera sp.]|nr:PEPxxWA-CTERM sorting domain-containing protein [Methylotenera sp.]
ADFDRYRLPFSFYSSSLTASVNVYDDVNGGGNLLASLNLSPQNTNNCSGDPTGLYCNWSAVGVEFNGIAKSVNFGGTANRVGFDNITFGSSTPVTSVPEPETYAMLLAGLGLIGFSVRRRKASQEYA